MISLNATLIVQVVNFLFLMWALNRLLFRPILRNLEEREEKIHQLTKNSENLSLQAKDVREEYEKRIEQARIRALEEKDKVRSSGTEEAERMVKRALSEAERGITETRRAIMQAAETARREFSDLSSEISYEIYRKILGEN
jgi:F-type H+-transporting ATPase subunit b